MTWGKSQQRGYVDGLNQPKDASRRRQRLSKVRATVLIVLLGGCLAAAQPAAAIDGVISTLSGGQTLTINNSETPSLTSPFNIVLNYNDVPTAAEAAAFAAAEATWEAIIQGYQEDVASTNLTIDVNLDPIDGVGGILGSAGPTTAKGGTSTYLYSSTGSMTFDTADTANLALAGSLGDVILHEMGHVIGIGTLWSSSSAGIAGFQELYVNGSGQYTGAFGLAAYNAEFGQAGAFVPVELGGGAGTANAHWNEVDNGAGLTGIANGMGQDMRNELMTGWLNAPTFISSLTTESLVDLGYNVVPEPSSYLLMLGGLAALLLVRRRRGRRSAR